jgi:hypothetical protein
MWPKFVHPGVGDFIEGVEFIGQGEAGLGEPSWPGASGGRYFRRRDGMYWTLPSERRTFP